MWFKHSGSIAKISKKSFACDPMELEKISNFASSFERLVELVLRYYEHKKQWRKAHLDGPFHFPSSILS